MFIYALIGIFSAIIIWLYIIPYINLKKYLRELPADTYFMGYKGPFSSLYLKLASN